MGAKSSRQLETEMAISGLEISSTEMVVELKRRCTRNRKISDAQYEENLEQSLYEDISQILLRYGISTGNNSGGGSSSRYPQGFKDVFPQKWGGPTGSGQIPAIIPPISSYFPHHRDLEW